MIPEIKNELQVNQINMAETYPDQVFVVLFIILFILFYFFFGGHQFNPEAILDLGLDKRTLLNLHSIIFMYRSYSDNCHNSESISMKLRHK